MSNLVHRWISIRLRAMTQAPSRRLRMAHWGRTSTRNRGSRLLVDSQDLVSGKGLFRELPDLLLLWPAPPPPCAETPRAGRARTTLASTRSSLRLAARPSPVPVAQCAQRKLMRELDFINAQTPTPDAAVTAYVDMYAEDLPERAIKAIRAAMRMGNKKLAKVLGCWLLWQRRPRRQRWRFSERSLCCSSVDQ